MAKIFKNFGSLLPTVVKKRAVLEYGTYIWIDPDQVFSTFTGFIKFLIPSLVQVLDSKSNFEWHILDLVDLNSTV